MVQICEEQNSVARTLISVHCLSFTDGLYYSTALNSEGCLSKSYFEITVLELDHLYLKRLEKFLFLLWKISNTWN